MGFAQLSPSYGLQIARMMGSTCWHNSPQARAAIQAIIDFARTQSPTD
ncbi:hypothetical protein [Metapseudomonas otitidis]|nr:hypothetical protein [Pseudomonas otitidis]